MHLSELSRRSGVSVASIKYYQREGLLSAGTPITARKADYGEEHLRRLRLIRALLTVGGMTIAQARDVLAVADDPAFGRHERIGIAQYMLPPHIEEPTPDTAEHGQWQAIRAELAAYLRSLGWRFEDATPALDLMTSSLLALRQLGYRSNPDLLRRYAEALRSIAEDEYAMVAEYEQLEDAIEAMISYTLLMEPALAGLRRLAHEDVSNRWNYGDGSSGGDGSAGESGGVR